jgi:hypothetical protein
MKIFISLDLILKDEESKNKPNTTKNKPDNNINSINNTNLSFITEKNKNIIDNDISGRNTHDLKDEQKSIMQTDSMKSKTPKIVPKKADKIINNHKVENGSKGIFGPLDLEIDIQTDNINSNTNNGLDI